MLTLRGFMITGVLAAGLFLLSCADEDPPGGGSCGPEPETAECRTLCELGCDRLSACGVDEPACLTACFTRYACPGETPDHDVAICNGEITRLPTACPDLCTWGRDFGDCTTGEAWSSFFVRRGSGPCPPGMTCVSSWLVRPDGTIEKSTEGTSGEAMLTTTDRAALDAVLTDPAFQTAMRDGFTCDPPPTDIGITFQLVVSGTMLEQDVTGCVLTGPAGNAAEDAYGIVTAY